MSTITFLFRGTEVPIQCSIKEKLVTIIQKFCAKAKVNRNQVNFLFNGAILDEQITEDKIHPNEENKKFITADYNSNDEDEENVLIKSKEILCPSCHKCASISVNDDYKITIDNCENGHKTGNIMISEFEKTQIINISEIICDKCKNKNMGNVFNNEFYRCINCKKNLCPMCKKEHNLNDNIIKYENIFYICQEHGEPFISYCNDCKKNLCFTCEEKHNNHNITDFKKLRKNKSDLEKGLFKFRQYIDKTKELVDLDIKNYQEKWNKVLDNYETLYKIKKEIIIILDNSLRNLQKLLNQEFIMQQYEKDFQSIINSNNINDRYINISRIYERMEEKEEEFNNIIYYSENYKDEKFGSEENNFIDYLEKITPGAFIPCNDIPSLELIQKEIIIQRNKDKKITFNIITNERSIYSLIYYLNSNIDFKNCFIKVCVLCNDKKKFFGLKEKYDFIFGIYDNKSDIKKFIESFSSTEIRPFPMESVVTYDNYINKYRNIHEKISKSYGDLTYETFHKYFQEIEKLIKDEDKDESSIKNPEALLESFKSFDTRKDSDEINKVIIKECTRDGSYYYYLDEKLKNPKKNTADTISYFVSRLMYSLNNYAKNYKMFFDKDKTKVWAGIRIPFSSLLTYERAINKIIIFPSFIETFEIEKIAEVFAGRNRSTEHFKEKNLFSVILIITINHQKTWISNGINVQNLSYYRNEREILFQCFSFFYLEKIKIDINNYTADIYLQSIGKKEILEEGIKNGKTVVYDEKNNIMELI